MDPKVTKGKWKLFLDFFLLKYNANLLITSKLNVADAASLEIDVLLPKN